MILGGLDIETTGLSQVDGDRIIEVALKMYEFNPVSFEHRHKSDYAIRINPQRAIDAKAEAVHGISLSSLLECPTIEDVAPALHHLMAECDVIVAHNGIGFDLPFVFGEFIRLGIPAPVPEVRVVDTLLQGRWATPDGAVPNLGALAFASGVEYDKSKAHGAAYDVEVMMACFFKHLPAGFFSIPSQPFVYEVPTSKVKAK